VALAFSIFQLFQSRNESSAIKGYNTGSALVKSLLPFFAAYFIVA
jgi:hypothetical protein